MAHSCYVIVLGRKITENSVVFFPCSAKGLGCRIIAKSGSQRPSDKKNLCLLPLLLKDRLTRLDFWAFQQSIKKYWKISDFLINHQTQHNHSQILLFLIYRCIRLITLSCYEANLSKKSEMRQAWVLKWNFQYFSTLNRAKIW